MGLDLLAREVREGPSGGQGYSVDYGAAEPYVSSLADKLESMASRLGVSARWLAAALLAGDPDVAAVVDSMGGSDLVAEARKRLKG